MATGSLPTQEQNLAAHGSWPQDRNPLDLEAPDNVGLPQGQVYLLPSQGEGLQITVVVEKSGFLVLRPNGSSQGTGCPLSFCSVSCVSQTLPGNTSSGC